MDAPVRDAVATGDLSEMTQQRAGIRRTVVGIGIYAAAFGLTFGALSVAAGLTTLQTMVLSVILFSGASQFALVGVVAAGGAPVAGLVASLLLGVRNAFYGVPITHMLRPRGLRRAFTAHFVIDETTAMTVAQRTPAARHYAFWATASALFVCWNLGTLAGALIGSGISTSAFGLDAAAPAIFLALLWPQLRTRQGRGVAAGGAIVALTLITLVPAGVPIMAAAVVAVVVGALPAEKRGRR